MKYRILVVDDEEDNLNSTCSLLEHLGYIADPAKSGAEALLKIEKHEYAVILLDYRMPDKNGAVVLKEIRHMTDEPVILLYSAYKTDDALLEVLQAGGAVDFIDKMVSNEVLHQKIKAACIKYEETTRRLKPTSMELNTEKLIASVGMVGRSLALAEVVRLVLKFKKSRENVLLIGETGIGKELIAAALHDGPSDEFRVVNGADYSESSGLMNSELFGHEKGSFTGAINNKVGILESARGGTVFFDEMHKLSLEAQSKLLRTLQGKTVRRVGGNKEYELDFRIIAAVQSDIEERVKDGRFLEDLYYRIKVLQIKIPPLREHIEDIAPLVVAFTKKFNEKTGEDKYFLMQTIRHFERYSWPGNVRELEGALKNILTVTPGRVIKPEHLKGTPYYSEEIETGSTSYDEFKLHQERQKREFLASVIRASESVAEAAKRLGMKVTTLHSMMDRYGIEKDKVG